MLALGGCLLILIALVVFVFGDYYQQKLGVAAMPTLPRVRAKMRELVDASPGSTIVELGAGWGGLTYALARDNPECTVIAFEFSLFPYLMCKIRHTLTPSVKNITFLRRDFFTVSLHNADRVVCYLSNPLMARLKDKLKTELPPGAKIISSTFFIPDWPHQEIVVEGLWDTNIFVYEQDER